MTRALVLIAVLALVGSAAPAGSAETGQAYDQITKFTQTGDVASVEPGDFDADWQVAAAPAPEHKTGGMFAKFRAAIDAATSMGDLFKKGLAEKRYVAGAMERVDTPATQKATITNCSARTITYLDLKAKTYRVVSMDHPEAPTASSGGKSEPGPRPTDDGTRIAVTAVNRALGQKQVYGNASSGYTSEVTIVTTKANGDSSTSKTNLKEYVSGSSRLWLNCSAGVTEGQEGLSSALSRFSEITRSLGGYKNPRFTVSSSGPPLPRTLAYFEAMGFSGDHAGDRQGGSLVIAVERNNVRSISSADSVFSVPADFTKVDN